MNLSAVEAGRMLRVTPRTISRWCKTKQLKSYRLGNMWITTAGALKTLKRVPRGRPPAPKPKRTKRTNPIERARPPRESSPLGIQWGVQ
jgi:hypothetical protein